jgi:hypothetical protein
MRNWSLTLSGEQRLRVLRTWCREKFVERRLEEIA